MKFLWPGRASSVGSGGTEGRQGGCPTFRGGLAQLKPKKEHWWRSNLSLVTKEVSAFPPLAGLQLVQQTDGREPDEVLELVVFSGPRDIENSSFNQELSCKDERRLADLVVIRTWSGRLGKSNVEHQNRPRWRNGGSCRKESGYVRAF